MSINYYPNQNVLNISGYEIYFTRFSDSILKDHFKEAQAELEHILSNFYLEEKQIIMGGGGLSTITQSLAKLLNEEDWRKKIIESRHYVEEKMLTSESHEVDHYKSFEKGNIGLEIEWNNKDPFYDRDLENFRKLHQIGELSLGIIITRGTSLQRELLLVFQRFLDKIYPFDINTLQKFVSISDSAKSAIGLYLNLEKRECIRKVANTMYGSKFGAATTHMEKLLLRLNRGVGNPCPFILIGIGKDRLKMP